MASCKFMPCTTCRRKKAGDHWSCWSPPGVPNTMYGSPSRSASEGDSEVQGMTPGVRVFGRPSSSHVICSRVLIEKPRPGITGLEDSHPPDGVAATMLPCLSITSMWQVSPTNTSRSSHSDTGGSAAKAVFADAEAGVCRKQRAPGGIQIRQSRRHAQRRARIEARRLRWSDTCAQRWRRYPSSSRADWAWREAPGAAAVPREPVRQSQLGRFRDAVNEARGVRRVTLQLCVAEHSDLLQERRPLAPEPAFRHRVATEIHAERRFDRGPPPRHVVVAQQALVLLARGVPHFLGAGSTRRSQDATKPSYQQRSAASMTSTRLLPSRCGGMKDAFQVEASSGKRYSAPGTGTRSSRSHTAADERQCARNRSCTAVMACTARGINGKPSRA